MRRRPPIDTEMLRARLEMHVERLAGLIGPRHPGKPSTMEAAEAYVTLQFAEAGYDVERRAYDAGGVEVANIVAEIPGSARPDEIVVLGAHYDTVPETPGADDNASAVAVLLESARLLREVTPRRTVRFVAFPCEEPPYFYTSEMGSQVYAAGCRERNENVIGMLCLEMVGYYSREKGSQRAPELIPKWLAWLLPKTGDFLAAVGNMRSWRLALAFRRGFKRGTRTRLFTIALPEVINEIRLSDNAAFWDEGYRALMLTDTSFFRNPHYHLPSDTPDTLDYEIMTEVAKGVAGAVRHIARG